jgi:hypothetical protein
MKKILTLIIVLLLAGSGSLWAQKNRDEKDPKAPESQVKPSVSSSFFRLFLSGPWGRHGPQAV